MSSRYISNKFLNWLLNGQTLSTIPSLRVGLLTVMPDEDGLNYSEPVGGGYQRSVVDPSFFSDSTQMQVENTSRVAFPAATLGWGTVVGAAIFEVDGTLAWASEFQNPITILPNDVPAFPPGSLKFFIGAIPDGYYEEGSISQIPDGYYEDGEIAPVPSTLTSWGWQKDLTTSQWQSYLAESQWTLLTRCTAEQAAAAFYVQNGELFYDAALAIAAGASNDFSAFLRLPPKFHYTVEANFKCQRDLVPAGGFLDVRLINSVNQVQTNFPSINRDAVWFRIPASPDNFISQNPVPPTQPAYLVGMNNSSQAISNFSRFGVHRIYMHKWAPASNSSQDSNLYASVTDGTYLNASGTSLITDGRTILSSANDMPDDARVTVNLLLATVDGVTNNAKGTIHTCYFFARKIEF